MVVAFSVGLPGIPFALGDLWFGALMTVITVVILAFLWNERLTDLPDLEEPAVISWTGELTQKATRLGSARVWFGGRRVHLPDHWVDLIPGERTFGGEAAVLPDEKKPFLLKTSTGLSVEKEVGWGLLNTFSARPQRQIGCLLGLSLLFFYCGFVTLELFQGEFLRALLFLRGMTVSGMLLPAGILSISGVSLYYFGKHRWAFGLPVFGALVGGAAGGYFIPSPSEKVCLHRIVALRIDKTPTVHNVLMLNVLTFMR